MDSPTTYVPERRPLSEADVHRVCEALAKEGVGYISIEKVRDRLGRGSNTTVGKWIRTWAKDRDRPEAGETPPSEESPGDDEPRLEVISLSEHQRRLAEQKALFGDLMAARIDAEVERTKAVVRADVHREAEERIAGMKADAVRAIEEARAVEQRVALAERERLLAEQRSRVLEEGGRIRRRALTTGGIAGATLGGVVGVLAILAWAARHPEVPANPLPSTPSQPAATVPSAPTVAPLPSVAPAPGEVVAHPTPAPAVKVESPPGDVKAEAKPDAKSEPKGTDGK